MIRTEHDPEALKSEWNARLPGKIPERVVIAEELGGQCHQARRKRFGRGRSRTHRYDVPAIGLVVAGDAAYNGVHQFLGETNLQKRREWIAALDKIESLQPRAVIAGHKRRGSEDSPRIIEETRQYVRDFDRLAEMTKTARELYDQMLRRHPLRMKVNALWTSTLTIKG